MSLTLRALGLRVCYFLGYYEERVKKLEDEINTLKEKLELLGSTTCLHIQTCNFEGCENWWIDGDDKDMVQHNKEHFLCDDCLVMVCEKHAVQNGWYLTIGAFSYCEKCRNK